ncbi:hypothetical protein, partial [Bacteroides heparinolyticus]|uniref:hypothetical protein n=1 Tax=Prevotella heparinolytica TaxID=28113 RepID=UPI0035A1D327
KMFIFLQRIRYKQERLLLDMRILIKEIGGVLIRCLRVVIMLLVRYLLIVQPDIGKSRLVVIPGLLLTGVHLVHMVQAILAALLKGIGGGLTEGVPHLGGDLF